MYQKRGNEFTYFSVRFGSPKGLESLEYPDTALAFIFFATFSACRTTPIITELVTETLTGSPGASRTETRPPPAHLLLRLLRHVLHELLLGDAPALAAPAPLPVAAPGVGPGVRRLGIAGGGGGGGLPPAPAAVAAPAPSGRGRSAGVGGVV